MRIIMGEWAETKLVSPGKRVRPTAENVRDAWMDLIADRLKGAQVLDLFAGSGALGLEAMSRGAVHVDFVENGPEALHALKANVATLPLSPPRKGWRPGVGVAPSSRKFPSVRIFKKDAIPFAEALEKNTYDIAFADPPYGSAKLDRIIAAWMTTRFATILGVEHATEHELPDGGKRLDFGESSVTIFGLPGSRKRRSRGKKREGKQGEGSKAEGKGAEAKKPADGKKGEGRKRETKKGGTKGGEG